MAKKTEIADSALNAFAARLKQAEDLKKQQAAPAEVPTPPPAAPVAVSAPPRAATPTAAPPAAPSATPSAKTTAPQPAAPQAPAPAVPLVIPPRKREPKDIQKQVRVTRSLNKAIDAKCARLGIPYNEVVNQLLAAWVEMDN